LQQGRGNGVARALDRRPFNSFPVAADRRVRARRRSAALSILSQLQPSRSSSSWRWHTCTTFQFFPSCSPRWSPAGSSAFSPFNSFPVAAFRVGSWEPSAPLAFNSFPVAAELLHDLLGGSL